MKIMKKGLLALTLISMSATLLPLSSAGTATLGAAGAIAGTALIAHEVHKHRDPDYRLRKDIERTEKALSRAENDIENARSEQGARRAQERAQRLTNKLNQLNRRYAIANA